MERLSQKSAEASFPSMPNGQAYVKKHGLLPLRRFLIAVERGPDGREVPYFALYLLEHDVPNLVMARTFQLEDGVHEGVKTARLIRAEPFPHKDARKIVPVERLVDFGPFEPAATETQFDILLLERWLMHAHEVVRFRVAAQRQLDRHGSTHVEQPDDGGRPERVRRTQRVRDELAEELELLRGLQGRRDRAYVRRVALNTARRLDCEEPLGGDHSRAEIVEAYADDSGALQSAFVAYHKLTSSDTSPYTDDWQTLLQHTLAALADERLQEVRPTDRELYLGLLENLGVQRADAEEPSAATRTARILMDVTDASSVLRPLFVVDLQWAAALRRSLDLRRLFLRDDVSWGTSSKVADPEAEFRRVLLGTAAAPGLLPMEHAYREMFKTGKLIAGQKWKGNPALLAEKLMWLATRAGLVTSTDGSDLDGVLRRTFTYLEQGPLLSAAHELIVAERDGLFPSNFQPNKEIRHSLPGGVLSRNELNALPALSTAPNEPSDGVPSTPPDAAQAVAVVAVSFSGERTHSTVAQDTKDAPPSNMTAVPDVTFKSPTDAEEEEPGLGAVFTVDARGVAVDKNDSHNVASIADGKGGRTTLV